MSSSLVGVGGPHTSVLIKDLLLAIGSVLNIYVCR